MTTYPLNDDETPDNNLLNITKMSSTMTTYLEAVLLARNECTHDFKTQTKKPL